MLPEGPGGLGPGGPGGLGPGGPGGLGGLGPGGGGPPPPFPPPPIVFTNEYTLNTTLAIIKRQIITFIIDNCICLLYYFIKITKGCLWINFMK
mgnify:CR=1 FL=1